MALAFFEPTANGVATGWAGNGFLDVADGATANDATFTNSGVVLDTRESYRLSNASVGTIPDGAVINFVQIQARVQRGGTQNASFVLEVGHGAGPTWSPSGTLTCTDVWTEFTNNWTTDPATGLAWTVATLRAWATTRDFAVRNTQTRDVRLGRMRVVVDFTPPTVPTITGQPLNAAQGVAIPAVRPRILGGALATTQGLSDGVVGVIGSYAGPWPVGFSDDYTTLDPYYLTPVGLTTIGSLAVVNATASVDGQGISVSQGTVAVAIPGVLRTVTLLGQQLAALQGLLRQENTFSGAVMARVRSRVARGVERWRKRSRLTTTSPTFLSNVRNVTQTLTGQTLASAAGTVTVQLPGVVLPAVRVLSRRIRDAIRAVARRNSKVTQVSGFTSPDRTVRPTGFSITATPGTVQTLVPRAPFVGQVFVGVSRRTRDAWRNIRRPKSITTQVSSSNASIITVRPTGAALTATQGVPTTSGASGRNVYPTGQAITSAQGTTSRVVSRVQPLIGSLIQTAQGAVLVNRISIQGSLITIGLGTVTIGGQVSVTVGLVGATLTTVQGALLRANSFDGSTYLTVSSNIRKFGLVAIAGSGTVTLQHQILRIGAADFAGSASLAVNATMQYRGSLSTGGTATMAINLSAIPASVLSLFQQFEAEQQLGYKP